MQRLFDSVSPNGMTPIGDTLDRLLRTYISKLESAKEIGTEDSVKPVNFIVLTDGTPSELPLKLREVISFAYLFVADDPAEVIVNAARRLDRGNFLLSQVRCICRSVETVLFWC